MLSFELDVRSLVDFAFWIKLLEQPEEYKLNSNDDAEYLAEVESTAIVSTRES